MKKTIFDKLSEANVPYSVCVALNSFSSKGLDVNSRDYYLMAKKEDIKSLKFKKRKSDFDLIAKKDLTDENIEEINQFKKFKDIVERSLTTKEINEFKRINDEFVKVNHDKNGRVYELKNNSFRKHFKSDIV